MSNDTAINRSPKRYSLEQANSMLSLIRDVIGQLQDAEAVCLAEADQLAFFKQRQASFGRSEFDQEFEEVREHLLSSHQARQRCVEELRSWSVFIDPDDCTHVDIAGSLDGKPMLWCWKTDESQITHWHHAGEGLADRQSV